MAKSVIKFFISFALVAFVLSKIDIAELTKLLTKSNLFLLFLAFIFFNLSKIISSIRLNYYFNASGAKLSQIQNLKLYYLGMFYNLFLPGGIGGDGYKVYLLHKLYQASIKRLIEASLLDRISGLVALVFLAALILLFSKYCILFPFLKIVAILGLLTIYPLFILLHKRFFPFFFRLLSKTLLLGLLVQILQIISAYLLLQSLLIEENIMEFLFLFLLSSVVAILPLTIGGVGAREATFLYGLKILGLDPNLGVAFSFLFFLITALSSLLGIFFLNFSHSAQTNNH